MLMVNIYLTCIFTIVYFIYVFILLTSVCGCVCVCVCVLSLSLSLYIYIYIYYKQLIAINRIQNKGFCFHNICVFTVYIYYVYINTNTCMNVS